MPKTPDLFTAAEEPVRLGREIGRGGEGAVYAFADRDDVVAKLYHISLSPEHATKLEAMVRLGSDRLLSVAAWPVDTLHSASSEPAVGLVLPRIADSKEIHKLYSPRSRRAEFPSATWPFLIHTAGNLARAFAAIHACGHVVGDVNHGNILVSQAALVRLIDCDSFQVTAEDQRFLCGVGVSTHTPPELQGSSFEGIERTCNHDNFGLAVLIFQLLFMGRHPFSGQYLGAGEMSLERAIAELRFAYGSGAASREMRQPPATLPLEAASGPVAELFERAFGKGGPAGSRPRPEEWVQALAGLSHSLQRCGQNPGHHFLKDLTACPWCSIEEHSGIILFAVAAAGQTGHSFDIEALWAEIQAIPSPGPLPRVQSPSQLALTPSPCALARATRHKRQAVPRIAVVAVLIFLMPAIQDMNSGILAIIAIFIVLSSIFVQRRENRDRAEQRSALTAAQTHWDYVQRRWLASGAQEFNTVLKQFERDRADYLRLPALRHQALADLESRREADQLDYFLENFRLEDAHINGLGPGRTATLASYGIETAADISWSSIGGVPGFGPALTERLLEWRSDMGRGFVFDPRRGVDPAKLAALEHDHALRRAKLEIEMRHTAGALKQMSARLPDDIRALVPEMESSTQALAQAQVDYRYVVGKLPAIPPPKSPGALRSP